MKDEHVPFHTKILYGAGDITNSVLNTIIAVYFLKFLTDVVHLSPFLAGAAIFVGRSADWINDPIIGYLSDRTRTRWGRRRPFLLFGMAPLALAFIFFFWVPPWENQIALAVYYGLMYAVLDTMATFVYMPYYALTPELTLDYDERTALTTARMLFSIVGSLIAFTVPLFIIDALPDPRMGYFVMAIVFGVVGVLPLLFTFFGTRERPEFQEQVQPSLRESLAAVRRNRPFQFGLGMFLLTWTTIDIIQVMLLYFIQYWLHMESIAELIMGSVFISAAIFLPLWNWISSKWDKPKAYIAGMSFFAAIMIVLILVQPGTPMAVVFTITALAGIGVAAAHVIPWSILPDAIEWDELQTGQRHEGAFYSLVTLAQKIASSIAVPLAAWVLGLSGYQANVAEQVPSALLAIRGLVGGVPALMSIGGIIFALLYPLSREEHADVRRQLAERRSQAAGDS
jgi:GPH family glycoside/pentoside/hexuronide:cation symporter